MCGSFLFKFLGVLSLPGRFFGDPASLARNNILGITDLLLPGLKMGDAHQERISNKAHNEFIDYPSSDFYNFCTLLVG